MRRNRNGLGLLGLVIATTTLVACGGGSGSDELDAEWASIQEEKQALDAKRAEFADLNAQLGAAEASEEEDAAAQAEALTAQIGQAEQEVVTATEEFGARLVGFLNADPMIAGEEPTERQIEAIRIKSSEDLVVAQEWIDKGGDYRRAIEIINSAIALDPDNPDLEAALAAAETDRYMSEERFAAVEKGMMAADVQAAIGLPIHQNIREYPDRGVTAWFYPTNEAGDAAGIWFETEGETGELKVYQIKYAAITRDEEEG